jgi:hypothetical protein
MRNTYLDPSQTWLEFTFTPTFAGATLAKFDGSANTIIKKIEVYSSAGSNLLESIDNVSVARALNNTEARSDDSLPHSTPSYFKHVPTLSAISTTS